VFIIFVGRAFKVFLRARSIRFHQRSLDTCPLAAFAAVFWSSHLKLWSCRYSLTDVWPARAEFLISELEGYASFLRAGLWWLVVVGFCWGHPWCVP
jgi:hypothetical protein